MFQRNVIFQILNRFFYEILLLKWKIMLCNINSLVLHWILDNVDTDDEETDGKENVVLRIDAKNTMNGTSNQPKWKLILRIR